MLVHWGYRSVELRILTNVHSNSNAQPQSDTIKPGPTRSHRLNTFLPQLRLDQTPFASEFWRHQLPQNFSPCRKSIPFRYPCSYTRHRFLSSRHRPPPDNSYSPLSSSFSTISKPSHAPLTLPTCSSFPPSPSFNPPKCYAHSPTLTVSALDRPRPLDREPVRRCARTCSVSSLDRYRDAVDHELWYWQE